MNLWLRMAWKESLLWMDKKALQLNLKYAEMGIRLPQSEEWLPNAYASWDSVLIGILLGMLGATMVIKQQLWIHRIGRQRAALQRM